MGERNASAQHEAVVNPWGGLRSSNMGEIDDYLRQMIREECRKLYPPVKTLPELAARVKALIDELLERPRG
jgi:hypothetical protein